MKMSVRMSLIFSVMMLSAVVISTFYLSQMSLSLYNDSLESRFQNAGVTLSSSIERQITLMDLALDDLTNNTSFMAALNRAATDDTADPKLANAATAMLAQTLYRSPLVESFYRVSVYNRNGFFISSRFEKENVLENATAKAREVINGLTWLSQVDAAPYQRHIIVSHRDFPSVMRDMQVFSAVKAVMFHGKQIAYMDVATEQSALKSMVAAIGTDGMKVQAVFDDGNALYSDDVDTGVVFSPDLPLDRLVSIQACEGVHRLVMRIRDESLGLNIYISQDSSISERETAVLIFNYVKIALLTAIPTLVMIVLSCIRLSRSTTRFAKRVRQLPVDDILQHENFITETVTLPSDIEIYQLESAFNNMMLKLRDSALNELSMREGTLQAQLNALQTQINPHFIYNTLNIISAKSMESGNLDVIEICDQFAQMLRYSTDTRSRTATMIEELENVRNYLYLAKARYEDNLEFTINVPEDLRGLEVPKLTLQPIVENALSHGYDGKNVQRKLFITGSIADDLLLLEIRDNGNGFSPEMLAKLRKSIRDIEMDKVSIEAAGGHIGLVNTCLRLHYYSKGAMHISIRNDSGAVVCLTLPCRPAGKA